MGGLKPLIKIYLYENHRPNSIRLGWHLHFCWSPELEADPDEPEQLLGYSWGVGWKLGTAWKP